VHIIKSKYIQIIAVVVHKYVHYAQLMHIGCIDVELSFEVRLHSYEAQAVAAPSESAAPTEVYILYPEPH
jgi:hypothetical protein